MAAPGVSVVIGLLILLTTAQPLAAQAYTVVELGVLPGYDTSQPHDINNQLQIVGTSGGQAFLWEPTRLRSLGVIPAGRLHINNAGIVAGLRVVGSDSCLFAWIDGTVYDIPPPPEPIQEVRELTDAGILLVQGTRSWAFFRENWYDLTAYLGGEVYAITDTGFAGGIAGLRGFLRFPDGRTIVPWSAPAPVRLIGSSGHFAGYRSTTTVQPEWYVGNPDGSITTIPPSSIGVSMSFGGINRHGVIVGGLHRHGGRFSVFVYRDGIVSEGLIPISSGLRLELAYGINDAGYIIALATPATLPYFTSSRAVLLVPTTWSVTRD